MIQLCPKRAASAFPPLSSDTVTETPQQRSGTFSPRWQRPLSCQDLDPQAHCAIVEYQSGTAPQMKEPAIISLETGERFARLSKGQHLVPLHKQLLHSHIWSLHSSPQGFIIPQVFISSPASSEKQTWKQSKDQRGISPGSALQRAQHLWLHRQQISPDFTLFLHYSHDICICNPHSTGQADTESKIAAGEPEE